MSLPLAARSASVARLQGLLGRALGLGDAGLGLLVHVVDADLVALHALLRLLDLARKGCPPSG